VFRDLLRYVCSWRDFAVVPKPVSDLRIAREESANRLVPQFVLMAIAYVNQITRSTSSGLVERRFWRMLVAQNGRRLEIEVISRRESRRKEKNGEERAVCQQVGRICYDVLQTG
jgi:ribosomal protein L39E